MLVKKKTESKFLVAKYTFYFKLYICFVNFFLLFKLEKHEALCQLFQNNFSLEDIFLVYDFVIFVLKEIFLILLNVGTEKYA